jgi:hypothetical protein
LQWDEYDLESRLINHLEPGLVEAALDSAAQLYSGICRAIGGDHLPWIAKLEDVFAKIGLQDIEVNNRPIDPIWSKYWHEQEMSFCMQIIDAIATRNQEMAEKLHELQRIVQDAKYQGRGYVNNLRPVVAVGRKPVQQTRNVAPCSRGLSLFAVGQALKRVSIIFTDFQTVLQPPTSRLPSVSTRVVEKR